ncbi:helix-turn-helix domain-containing protein [Eudoraea chungangensis]|uniref:helix-turn-helix domain-containing protein n=1 Tax=Eudoraea chungangensis TaxID=1481905 RepID=UPI0023EC1C9C|nr:helix-turn-helix transcriptional regulator [Eudoraea chungangensis]
MSNRLMGFFLITFSIHISVFLYSRYLEMPLIFEQFRDQLILLLAPLCYLYFVSVLRFNFKFEKKHLIHLTPFILVSIIFMPRFFMVSELERIVFYQSFHAQLESKTYAAISIFSGAFYVVSMILLDYKNRTLRSDYSHKTHLNYKWLKDFIPLVILFFVFSFLRTIAVYVSNIDFVLTARTTHTVLLLAFVTWLTLRSLYTPEIFKSKGIKNQLVSVPRDKIFNLKNLPVTSDVKKINLDITRLNSYIIKEKPFLSPDLTIKELARNLNINTQDLSLLINRHIGKHFFDFINEYRIEMAIKILQNPERKSTHVLEIQYEVGFNSKSAFHRAFKKHTGKTPKQFRIENKI